MRIFEAPRVARLITRMVRRARDVGDTRSALWIMCGRGDYCDEALQYTEGVALKLGQYSVARLARVLLLCSGTQRAKADRLAEKL